MEYIGIIMLVGGIIGVLVCIVLLCILPGCFEKEKKNLLAPGNEEQGRRV